MIKKIVPFLKYLWTRLVLTLEEMEDSFRFVIKYFENYKVMRYGFPKI